MTKEIKAWDHKRLHYVTHPRLQKAVSLLCGRPIAELKNEHYNYFLGTAIGLYIRKILKLLAEDEQKK